MDALSQNGMMTSAFAQMFNDDDENGENPLRKMCASLLSYMATNTQGYIQMRGQEDQAIADHAGTIGFGILSLTPVGLSADAGAADLSPKFRTMTMMRFPINLYPRRSQNEETVQRRANH